MEKENIPEKKVVRKKKKKRRSKLPQYAIPSTGLKRGIRKYINNDELEEILAENSFHKRIGEIAFLFREAIIKSDTMYYSGGIYFFNGQHYENVSKDVFSDTIYDIMYDIGISKGDIVYKGREVVKIAESAIRKKVIKYEPYKIAFANGVLDLRDNSFSNFSPKHYIFGAVDYPYIPEHNTEDYAYLWHLFLREVLPDSRSRRLLQEFLGLLFVDRDKAKVDAMLFMIGRGANGKSVIFHTITGLLGADNVSNYDIAELISGKDRLLNIAQINGKRLNYCSDISSRDLNSENFKSLVAGEPQPARRHFKDPFMAYDIPFIIGNGNRMPPTKDLSEGFFRRVIILPFNVNIPTKKQNRNLASDLKKEYPAIFNWVLQGKDRITKQKYLFSEAPVSDEAILEYRRDSNNVIKWMDVKGYYYESHTYEVRHWVRAVALYEDYLRWCQLEGEYHTTIKGFGETMRDIGFTKRRYPEGQTYLVYGVKDGSLVADILATEVPPIPHHLIQPKDDEK